MFLLAFNSINQAILVNFFYIHLKKFWTVFYFFLLSAKTRLVRAPGN